jgi:dolichyl-diphosphooligosaccharide---protein glycosyltransferase
MSWYPLGRPVGTTIYPGMQVTAVFIKNHVLSNWSLNDVCVYMPCWFGAVATVVTGAVAYECSIPANASSNLLQFVLDLVVRGKPSEPPAVRIKGDTNKAAAAAGPVFGLVYSPAMECALCSMAMMSIVPAHLMRSMGGGYDNESVAVTAMVTTFYFWVRSLRTTDVHSHWFGICTGVAYFYMVAAWGGYVFVLNMIGVHAAVLVALGRFRYKIYMAYTIFYCIGTILAMQVPVVGLTPLKSLEQLGPAAVFLAYQVLIVTEYIKHTRQLTRRQAWNMRLKVFGAVFFAVVFTALFLAPKGYFGPISSRVRGLFVQHTKTGNPLVDSVAEHQAASPRAYFQYLHHVCSLAPIGFILIFFRLSDASSFLLTWGTAAYFFSHKMVRLILLTAPIGCVLAGALAGRLLAWSIHQWWDAAEDLLDIKSPSSFERSEIAAASASTSAAIPPGGKKKKGKKTAAATGSSSSSPPPFSWPDSNRGYNGATSNSSFEGLATLQEFIASSLRTKEGVMIKRATALLIFVLGYGYSSVFVNYSWTLAEQFAHPSIIQKARTPQGTIVKVDDYREAYWWLRDNTPEDARIMAWWDYGYQIAGIANRTTIADGNTWNHEHIALLGKALTTNVNEGYEIARHWADYILIWGGGGGDDLAKSPHLARIANSVYRDHCPDDPTCRAFGMVDRNGTPSPMMRRSLLYTLHSSGLKDGVLASPEQFTEVYRSKYNRVRIWKIVGVSEESKAWVADPANRKCDVAGSWFCPGQYPPGLNDILKRKTDFAQLEDFNAGRTDEEYTKQYFKDLNDPEAARRKILEKDARERALNPGQPALDEQQKQQQQKKASLPESDGGSGSTDGEQQPVSKEEQQRRAELLYSVFENNEQSTAMWEFIQAGNVKAIKLWLETEPWWAFLRSADGRGPMWWAFEQRNDEIVRLLMSLGVPHNDRDKEGLSPADLQPGINF